MNQKIGFLGCGNMGGAILYGALAKGVLAPENAFVYDISAEMMEKAAAKGICCCTSGEEVCRNSDIVIAAVKPQYASAVLEPCREALRGKALMSIMAGVTAHRISEMVGGEVRILRTMPNTPALVFEGAFAFCGDNTFTAEELEAATELCSAIGIVELLPEHLIDAVCALSGGGPAYMAMFVEAMADAGVKQGLPRKTAYRLAAQTCLGTAKMLLEMDIHPAATRPPSRVRQ